MRKSKRLAAVDVGTNSVRLLVADCDGSKTSTLARYMTITRLGAGVDAEGELLEEALGRTVYAIKGFCQQAEELSPDAMRIAATSALRDSANKEVFLERTSAATDIEPEVLSGEQEARLSFLGAVSDLARKLKKSKKALVFDIGGGSTEIMIGGREILGMWSRDVGCVRMSERFLESDPPSSVQLARMESHIVTEVIDPLQQARESGFNLAVGLAGTVTTISAIVQGLPAYESARIHHSRINREEVEEIYRQLASQTLEERMQVKGLEPARADVIVGGTAVLRAIMDLADIEDVLVSEKDILDGLVLDLFGRLSKDVG